MWKLINTTSVLAIIIAVAMVFNIPSVGLAQSDQASTAAPPQPQGGIATVVGVDQPDNCLRIRSGPGNEYDVIGCASMGDQLEITGVWTSNDWAQLADNGWVYGPQIYSDLRPPRTAYSRTPTYVVSEEVVPDYDDWAYLPDYGYDRYWYGSIPIFFYSVAAWRHCHPSWWWRGLQSWWWRDGHHGRRHWDGHSFRNFANIRGVNVAAAERANISALNRIGRTTRSASIASSNMSRFNVNRPNTTSPNIRRFNVNRPNTTSPNIRRFNANRPNTTSPNIRRFNVNRPNTTSPDMRRFNANRPNTTSPDMRRFNANRENIRSSTVNRFNTNSFRSGSTNASRSRAFSNPSQSFSTQRSFRSGSIGGGNFSRSAPSRSFSSPNIGGGGFRSGGGGFHGRAGGGGGRHR